MFMEFIIFIIWSKYNYPSLIVKTYLFINDENFIVLFLYSTYIRATTGNDIKM